MAANTKFELYDIISASEDKSYQLQATDLEGNVRQIISSADAKTYLINKFGTRCYNVLLGSVANISDAVNSLHETFRIYVATRQHNIDKQYQALFDYDYSPIENVDRYETETTQDSKETNFGKTTTESGTDTNSKTGTDAVAGSGTDTTTIGKSGFNNPSSYTPDERTQFQKGSTETTTHNTTDATQYGHKTTDGGKDSESGSGSRTLRVHGNIGVTRSDELLRFELDTRKISLAEFILDDFIDRYTYYC